MRWLIGFTLSIMINGCLASEMSVDQAVKRLFKEIESVELVRVPVPDRSMIDKSSPKTGDRRPSGTLPEGSVPTKGKHKVRRGETLDMVIRRIAPNSPLQKNVLRQAFVKANPHAFRRNNPNWLYAGSVLSVPDVEHLRQVVFKETPGSLKKNVADEKADWVRFP